MRAKRRSWGIAAACALPLSWLLTAAPSFAQSYPGGGQTPPAVRGEKFFRGNENFGKTGTDVLLFVIVALALLCLGMIVRRLARGSSKSAA